MDYNGLTRGRKVGETGLVTAADSQLRAVPLYLSFLRGGNKDSSTEHQGS